MLDTITVIPSAVPGVRRSLVDRDEYGPLGECSGGLFTASIVPQALMAERDELGRRLGAWVPDGFLL